MNPHDSQIQRCAVLVSLMGDSLPQMQVDRPGPGEELNMDIVRGRGSPAPSGEGHHGAAAGVTPVTPRPAASVIVLRGGAETLEVLLVRRTPAARFMGGVWVFP